jgi:hypothetical protein
MQHVPLSGHCSWNPNYFGTIDHGLLEAMLRERISAEGHIYNMTSIPKDFAHEWQGLCTRTVLTRRCFAGALLLAATTPAGESWRGSGHDGGPLRQMADTFPKAL